MMDAMRTRLKRVRIFLLKGIVTEATFFLTLKDADFL